MRTEKDSLGFFELPDEALYGIHSARARDNFPLHIPFHIEWFRAVGAVKLCCYQTCKKYQELVAGKLKQDTGPFTAIEDSALFALIGAAEQVIRGEHFEQFIVTAMSGGAGTSINMNVNEIITNLALLQLGKKCGEYDIIDPIRHANVFQSTNDVIPTSLRIAAMELLDTLEEKINTLRYSLELLEKKYLNTLRVAYTQMQEAVPTSYGRLFSSYNEALSRDWWRISKCFERIKVVNLGGSAVGTGISVPRYFIMEAVNVLRDITGKPVTRGENLADATINQDQLVEVHAILKAHAVNLEKFSSDMRILACDLSVDNGFSIPARQVGSSIMPGKVNPVIPEFVISCCHRVYANDSLIACLAAQGCLELNAYIPAMGHALLESLKLLIACDQALKNNLVDGISIDDAKARERLLKSPSVTTVIVPYVGYHEAGRLAAIMKQENLGVLEANQRLKVINERLLEYLLQPSNLLRLGFMPSQAIDEMNTFKTPDDRTPNSHDG